MAKMILMMSDPVKGIVAATLEEAADGMPFC